MMMKISANKMENIIQQKITERDKIDISNTQTHACPLSWLMSGKGSQLC
jgi:hypothetical protein